MSNGGCQIKLFMTRRTWLHTYITTEHDYIHTLPQRMITYIHYHGEWLHTAAKPHITPCEEECRWTWPSFRGKCEKKIWRRRGNVMEATSTSGLLFTPLSWDFPEMIYNPVRMDEEATSTSGWLFTLLSSPNRELWVVKIRTFQEWSTTLCEDGKRCDVMEATLSRGDMWMVFHTVVISHLLTAFP